MRMTYVDTAWSKWIQSENAAKNIWANAVGRFVWSKPCHYVHNSTFFRELTYGAGRAATATAQRQF